jgi:low affinity Fe/Cu permease
MVDATKQFIKRELTFKNIIWVVGFVLTIGYMWADNVNFKTQVVQEQLKYTKQIDMKLDCKIFENHEDENNMINCRTDEKLDKIDDKVDKIWQYLASKGK